MKTIHILLLLQFCIAFLHSQEIVSLADRRELMVDRYLIEQLHNCRLKLMNPMMKVLSWALTSPGKGPFAVIRLL